VGAFLSHEVLLVPAPPPLYVYMNKYCLLMRNGIANLPFHASMLLEKMINSVKSFRIFKVLCLGLTFGIPNDQSSGYCLTLSIDFFPYLVCAMRFGPSARM
jgi:hypothetical protein